MNWELAEETNPEYIKAHGYQPCINIATAGHVDHGKSTLVEALTGIWPARFSEELRRGITIRIGYADASFWKCEKCSPPSCYTTKESCPSCGSRTRFLRAVSFIDCPGHEALMATMLAGSFVADGAILVIGANEPVPQPQTREHVAALEIIGIKNVVIVQNKIDLVSKEEAIKNYEQIRNFVKGTMLEGSPIIPISAQQRVNLDALIEAIEKFLPTPKRDPTKPPRMYVLRSFNVNKPGSPVSELKGGVIGGTLSQGELRVGDEIELRPGIKTEKGYEPLFTKVVSLQAGGRFVEKASCGGLIGVGTTLDPSLTKADGLVGNLLGKPGTLPDVYEEIDIDAILFEKAIGTKDIVKLEKPKVREPLVIISGTSVTSGVIFSIRENIFTVKLKRPICASKGQRVSISRLVDKRWRLCGYGTIT